jgi:hypothetical protein
MGHGPEQHIEHAEHAQHASHHPFDRRVTVSIAIVAAVLAAVTMAGHRAHNETLRLQGEALQIRSEALRIQGRALRIQTEAGIKNTETSDAWAFYQAKKNREALYRAFLDFAAMMNVKDGAKAKEYWQKQSNTYKKELPEMKKDAERLTEETKLLQQEARKVFDDSAAALEESHEAHKSHVVHMKADRFDYGELGLQLGVVLCSLAILTKGRGFWYSGMLCALVGLLVALSGTFELFMESGGHH